MYINITESETADNKGSSSGLVYYLDKEKDNVDFVFAVAGFSFAGSGQNTGMAFTHLKDWSERGPDEGLLAVYTALQTKLDAVQEARSTVVPPPPSACAAACNEA